MIRVRLPDEREGFRAFTDVWRLIKPLLAEGRAYWLEINEDTRTLPQNARMWAQLTDLSRQIDWYGQKLTPEEWKDACTAALKGQKVIPGINGGFVVLGSRTSRMSKRDHGELMEFISAFGIEKGVVFTDPGDFSQHLAPIERKSS